MAAKICCSHRLSELLIQIFLGLCFIQNILNMHFLIFPPISGAMFPIHIATNMLCIPRSSAIWHRMLGYASWKMEHTCYSDVPENIATLYNSLVYLDKSGMKRFSSSSLSSALDFPSDVSNLDLGLPQAWRSMVQNWEPLPKFRS